MTVDDSSWWGGTARTARPHHVRRSSHSPWLVLLTAIVVLQGALHVAGSEQWNAQSGLCGSAIHVSAEVNDSGVADADGRKWVSECRTLVHRAREEAVGWTVVALAMFALAGLLACRPSDRPPLSPRLVLRYLRLAGAVVAAGALLFAIADFNAAFLTWKDFEESWDLRAVIAIQIAVVALFVVLDGMSRRTRRTRA